VLVWLHGGAWQSGAGALDWYSGAPLAARGDIVVVAPNYRLGALGWIAVAGETANVGLLDQEAAIDWVVQHIEALGGDPHNITVMGQSAGSMSIACMLMRQPRFQRAILQSASLGRGFRSRDQADEIAGIYLRAAGAADLEQARELPVQALLQAQQAAPVLRWLADEGAQRSLFAPVADGQVLPLLPEQALEAAAARVDVIAGYTHDEMAAFPGGGTDAPSQALGDQIYGASTRQWAADATTQGRAAWCYRFDHRPNPTFGACHCIELPFVFGTLAASADAPMLRGLQPQEARRLTDELQSHWLAFVRDRRPGWAPWPQQRIFS
jgi:para-nitrobenzyl esterase